MTTGRKQIYLSQIEIDLLICSLQYWLDQIAYAGAQNSKASQWAGHFTNKRILEMQERLKLLTVKAKR